MIGNEALDKALSVITSVDVFAVAKARAMVRGYHAQWAHAWAEYKVLEVEKEFAFPLLNPETSGASRSFSEAGKMDLILQRRRDAAIIVVEHKSSSDDLDPSSNYWDRLRMDTQVSKYFLAAQTAGIGEVGGVMYDVLGKPGQRPSKIPLTDSEGKKIVLDAGGTRVKTADGKKFRETGDTEKGYLLQTREELPQEFEQRVSEVIKADPHRYYAQRQVARLNSDILEYMDDTWSLSQQILYFRSRKLWPRNPQACTAYGSTCEFFDLCSGRASVDGVRYRKSDVAHAELKIQQDGQLQLLTNSRGQSLKRCARHHQLRYEDQIQRIQADEAAEALHLGTLVHLGLEQYFTHIKLTQN